MNRITPYLLPAMRSIIFVVGGLLVIGFSNKSLIEASAWWAPLCVLYNIVTIVVLWALCKKKGIQFKDLLGYVKGSMTLGSTLLLTGAMLLIGGAGMIGFSFVFYGGLPEFLIHPLPLWVALLDVVLLPITIVFAEMPLYYGYALNQIQRQSGAMWFANLYIIFFYALQHSFIPLLFDFKYMIYRFLSFLPLMIFLSLYYSKKKNLTTMMIGHGVMDFGTAIQIFVMSL